MSSVDSTRLTWKYLAEQWGVNVKHGGYRENGTWYHLLRTFPAAYFDRDGYLWFENEDEYRSCPDALLAKDAKKNWANFPNGISSVSGYVRRNSPADPNDGRDDELLAAFEGSMHMCYVQHRSRERRIREAKVRAALASGGGRLRCEVPGCGFDFEETYGEIGRHFAHVHHVEALGAYRSARQTTLDELAIVCANCHAMIHVGGQCRRLEDLAPHGRR